MSGRWAVRLKAQTLKANVGSAYGTSYLPTAPVIIDVSCIISCENW